MVELLNRSMIYDIWSMIYGLSPLKLCMLEVFVQDDSCRSYYDQCPDRGIKYIEDKGEQPGEESNPYGPDNACFGCIRGSFRIGNHKKGK